MSRLLATLIALTALGACATGGEVQDGAVATNHSQRGNSVDRQARARIGRADMLTQMAFWAGEYQSFPNDLEAARRFSEALRLGGRANRAAQIAGEALGRFANDGALMITYALSQIAVKNPQEALRPLALVAQSEPENWRARSALGAALDQLGRFEEARRAYSEALAIAPDNAAILTNLGVSHIMAGEPEQAEPVLRQASGLQNAPPETRQNLAVALALMGRFEEAEQIERIDLPPAQAAANIAYLRGLLSDSRRWGDMDRR